MPRLGKSRQAGTVPGRSFGMGNTHAIATRIRFGSDEAQAFNLVSRPWSSHYAIGTVWQKV